MCVVSRLGGGPLGPQYSESTAAPHQRRVGGIRIASVADTQIYIGSMTTAEDLASRYLALWQDYVTALLTELTMPEAVQRRAARGAERLGDCGPGERSARGQLPAAQPAAGTATAAGPSG